MEHTALQLKRLLGGIALATFATAAPALAGGGGSLPANETYINVSAQVTASCAVTVVAQPATFQVVPGQALGQETGSLGVNCTNATPYAIELGPGAYGVDGATPTRYMCNSNCNGTNAPADGIAYQIFQDSAETAPWGDAVGTNTVGGTGRGMGSADAINVPFYVDSPPGQSISNEVVAGSASYYSDQVLVTVSY
ncbi:MAG TPA: spore coat U domain-containing protein [Candidatus Dormibacteraeota bacterium]|nr:spore coat U domain-containing protein [Candidatus Dormibacteraeota bacterium]